MSIDLRKSLVAIKSSGGEIKGAGFFVTDLRYIMTCFHVVEDILTDDGSITIGLFSDSSERFVDFKASLISKSIAHENDLALLECSVETLNKISKKIKYGELNSPQSLCFRNSEIQVGVEYITYGFPGNPKAGLADSGKVVSKINNKRLIQLSSDQLKPGFSGAPIVIKDTNDVIGVFSKGVVNKDKLIGITKADFCISAENILNTFSSYSFFKRIKFFPNEALGKYKCLVICHKGEKKIVENLCSRANRKERYNKRMYWKQYANFDNESKEKLGAALLEADCIILWICGEEFYKVFNSIHSSVLELRNTQNKEVFLVNVDCLREDFEEDYLKYFKNSSYYPFLSEEKIFLHKQHYTLRAYKKVYQEYSYVYDDFLKFFYHHIVLFRDNLVRFLKKFDFDRQISKVIMDVHNCLENVEKQKKILAFVISGTRECGLDILRYRMMESEYICKSKAKPHQIVRNFEFLPSQKLEKESFWNHLKGEIKETKNEWIRDILEGRLETFFVFENYFGPELDSPEIENRLNCLSQFVDLIYASTIILHEDHIIFIIIENVGNKNIEKLNKDERLVFIDPINKLNEPLGEKALSDWKEIIPMELPPQKVQIINSHIPKTVYVDKFLFEICRLLGVEEIYHENLKRL